MPKMLDYAPPVRTPARLSLRRAGVLLLLAAAVLHGLSVQLNAGAPLRRGFGADTPLARQAKLRAAVVAPVERLADGRNLELHFTEPSPPTAASGMVTTGVYFGVAYALYPARAFVGEDDRVVNDAATLRAADHVPPAAWLHDHGVAAVVTFPVGDRGLLRATARPVR